MKNTTTIQYISSTVNHEENTVEELVATPAGTDNIEKMVKQVICEKLGLEETQIKAGLSFSDDLGVDSLDVFELMITIEHSFGIIIPEEEAEKLRGPDSLVEFIKKQKK
jgi:acyl carrier protein